MSRGPGRIQQAILDALYGTGEWEFAGPEDELRAKDVAHWFSGVDHEWDTEPSRAQLEAARRALKGLEAQGVVVSRLEAPGYGPPWRERCYRLKARPVPEQEEVT